MAFAMEEVFKSLQPLEYYRKFLEHDVRPDGRDIKTFRPTAINIGSITCAEGSSLVKIGNTTVACGVRAELSVPKTESPKCGFVVPSFSFPPSHSMYRRPGPANEKAQIMSQFLTDIISNSKLIDFEDLCVEKGKIVWTISCDLVCLDYDGNANDASAIALLSALRCVRLPKVVIDEEKGKASLDPKEKSSLKLSTYPIASTFALFDNVVLTDPTLEEENISSGLITVVITDNGKICAVLKPGGSGIKGEEMMKCIKQAKKRAKQMKRMIQEAYVGVDR